MVLDSAPQITFDKVLDWLPRNWLIVAVGADLLILGYAVGVLDAFEQGEALLPDFVRSFVEAEIIAWPLGLQVGVVMWLSTGVTFPLVTLLFVIVATGIALQVYASRVQRWLDDLVLGQFPRSYWWRNIQYGTVLSHALASAR